MYTWKHPAMSHPNQGLDTLLALNTNKRKRVWGFLGGSGKFGEGDRKNMFSKKLLCIFFLTFFFLAFLLLLQSTGSRCMSFSSCSTWAWQFQLKGSVLVEHGLHSSAAYEIFQDQGLNLQLEGRFLSIAPPGKSCCAGLSMTQASTVAQLVKNVPAMWETWVQSLGWEDPLERERLPTAVFWPGEFHGLCSRWVHKELDTTERLSLSLFSIHQRVGKSPSLPVQERHFYKWKSYLLILCIVLEPLLYLLVLYGLQFKITHPPKRHILGGIFWYLSLPLFCNRNLPLCSFYLGNWMQNC